MVKIYTIARDINMHAEGSGMKIKSNKFKIEFITIK
jgi:hypothetical protein